MFKKGWIFLKSAGFMAIVAIVSIGLAIYLGFFYEKQGDLNVDVMQPTKVLDIHESVGGLTVSYNGQELRSSNKNLWLVSATVRNVGNAVIRKDDFDESALLTLNVVGGEIVEKPTLISESKYIKDNLSPDSNGKFISFHPVIIEPGEKFSVSFFVLGDEYSKPNVTVSGKIAGLKDIKLQEMIDSSSKVGFWEGVLGSERWWYQIIRVFIYSIAFIVFIAVAVALFSAAFDFTDGRKSKKEKDKRINELNDYKPNEAISVVRKVFSDMYLSDGVYALLSIDACLKLSAKRKSLYDKLSNNSLDFDEKGLYELVDSAHPIPKRLKENYGELVRKNVIKDIDGVGEEVKTEFDSICDYLNFNMEEFRKAKSLEEKINSIGSKYSNDVIRSEIDF